MKEKIKKKRVSRDDWLKTALEVLAENGVEGVKIEGLARRIGVAKSGFYWHFRDRRDLLDAMLDYWEREYTEVVAASPAINELPPAERLQAISESVNRYNLSEFDLAIAAWAQQDARAAEKLQHSYKTRLQFLRKAFAELGFTGDDLEMRARLYVSYHSIEPTMFGQCTSAKDRRIRKLRIRLLTQQLRE
jgi:AcrR family transcriptional regulator